MTHIAETIVRSFKFILKVGVGESIENAPLTRVILYPYNGSTIESATPTLRINLNERTLLME
jgi:hypothetical protein